MGVSLGDERVLRLERSTSLEGRYEIPLPSGSVYIQRQVIVPAVWSGEGLCCHRDTVRYDYKHSILRSGDENHSSTSGRQRLSIMIRVSSTNPITTTAYS